MYNCGVVGHFYDIAPPRQCPNASAQEARTNRPTRCRLEDCEVYLTETAPENCPKCNKFGLLPTQSAPRQIEKLAETPDNFQTAQPTVTISNGHAPRESRRYLPLDHVQQQQRSEYTPSSSNFPPPGWGVRGSNQTPSQTMQCKEWLYIILFATL